MAAKRSVKLNVETWLIAGFLLFLAVLVINAAVSARSIEKVAEDRRWAAHTHLVILEMERLLSALKDTETGQRGYLITGQASYLQPYNQALPQVGKHLAQLKLLTRDNPDQQRRFPALEQLINARLDALKEGIDLRSRGRSTTVRQFILTGIGKQRMDAIRTLVAQMEQTEQDLLIKRDGQTAQSESALRVTFGAATAAGIVFLCLLYFLVSRFIYQRKQAAEALQKREEWLSTTLRSIGDGVIATDEQGRILFMNAVAERLTGWSEAEAKGQPCTRTFSITNEYTGQAAANPVERVLKEGVIVGLANHTILTASEGTVRPIADSGAPIRDPQGNLFGVVLVFRDVTEQRQAAAARERLAAIVQYSEDAIISKDLDGIITSWNPAAERLYGYSAEEAIGKSKSMVIPPDQSEELPATLRRIKAGEHIEPYETKRVRKGGTLFDVSISVSPLKDEEGQVIGASTIARDITRQKRAEEVLQFVARAGELLSSSLDYRQTLQTVARLAVPKIADWCAVDVLAEDGSIQLVAVEHVDPEKVRWAHELRNRYPPDPNDPGGLAHALRTGETVLYPHLSEQPFDNVTLEPEHAEIIRRIGFRSAMIVPMSARGRILGAITFVATTESGQHFSRQDQAIAEGLATRAALAVDNARLYEAAREEIARRAQREQAIAALNERLKHAMQETHHRVKNSLQVISALIDMQRMQHESSLPVSELERLNTHIRSLAVIHDLLTHQSKTDAEVEYVSVRSVLEKLLPMLQEMLHGRLTCMDIADLDVPIRQGTTLAILVNELVSNAVKHGRGEVELSFAVVEGKAHLAVCDNGPGFPAGFDATASAHTGLDLIESLVHWDLQGDVHYLNRPAGGARVIVEFPLDLAI